MKFLFILFTVVPVLAQDPPPALPTAISADSCYLDGRVTDRATGAPLDRAIVTLAVKFNRVDYTALTFSGGDGHFQFAGLPPGKYRLYARLHNKMQAAYGASKPGEAGEIITLAPGEARRGLLFPLGKMPSISGRVLDDDGDPIPNAQVMFLRDGFARGKRHLQAGASAMTDDRGEYSSNVAPGRYLVEATDRSMNRQISGSDVQANRNGQQQAPLFGYGYQFYPGTQRPSEASPITVGDQEVRGIDIRLPRVAKVNVIGHVTGAPEKLQEHGGQTILFQPEDFIQGIGMGPNFGIGMQPDHSFSLMGIAAGRYSVRLAITGADGKQYGATQSVEISPAANELNLRLSPAVELRGTVQVEGELQTSNRPARVGLTSGDGAIVNPPPPASVKDDFTFAIPNVPPGVWDIGVGPLPAGGFIKSMMLGDKDVLTEDMVIGSEAPPPLKIVISTRGGIITGKVENTGGKQPMILLVPEGKVRHVLSFYQMAQLTDDDAKFKLTGLTPGKYRLFAFDTMEMYAIQNPERWKPYEARGEVVDVAEGATVTKNLQMIVTTPAGAK